MSEQLIQQLAGLISEKQNPKTLDIDLLDSENILSLINELDSEVALAVKKVIPQTAQLVDYAVNAINKGGRLIYVGAGTSGRLGVLDAVECPPTFGIDDGVIIGLIAGGNDAMFKAQEGAEDSVNLGRTDLKKLALNQNDVIVGIAASGRTPYVIGALQYAKELGCKTAALSCNANAEIAKYSSIAILPIVGPECLTGSTRMKAGTAQKLILNSVSTALMIRLGKSYRNYMVDLKATNQKLVARGTRIIMDITGVSQKEAESKLASANNDVKVALMMILSHCDLNEARNKLNNANGFLRDALK